MAEFNIRPQEGRPENFQGYSRGIDHTANDALGTLFSNSADLIQRGVVAADALQQEHIRNQISHNVEDIQDEFGVGDATLFQSDADNPTQPTPKGVQMAGENLNRLQAGYEAGTLKESHYWARLNSMVRQLRQQYPGYRAEIDEMVAGITGARPANALRAALFDEWNASASDTDPLSKMEDWAVKNGRLPVDYYARMEQGNPYSLPELNKHVAAAERRETEIADMRAGLELEASQDKLNVRNAERGFRVEANQVVDTTLQDMTGMLGQQYRTLRGRIESAQAAVLNGHPPTQQSMVELTGAVGELRVALTEQLRLAYETPWGNDPENSYLATVDQDTATKIINDALTPLTMLENALANEDFGMLKSVTAWIEAKKNDATADLIDKIPMLPVLQGAQQVLGPDGFNLYMDMNPDLQFAISQAMLDYERARAITEEGASVSDAFTNGEANAMDTEYYNGLIESWTNTIDGLEKLPLEAVQKNVDYMFGPKSMEVLATMDDASRFEYFNKVASPMVTEKMRKLRDMGDVESWDNYQQWVTRNFMILFQSQVQTMQGMSTSMFTPGTQVVWDDSNSQFVYIPGQQVGVGAPFTTVVQGSEALMGADAVNRLNSVIRTVTPIIEDNNGTMGIEIYRVLADMGFNPETQTDFMGMMMLAIEGIFGSPEAPKANPAWGLEEPAVEDDRG
jgi:hypothetical protein